VRVDLVFPLLAVTGLSPLLLAVGSGHMHIVQMLLEAGADPETRSKDGRSMQDMLGAMAFATRFNTAASGLR